jgi:hypothetical protein
MSDILKPFRRCLLCKKRKNLVFVTQPHYSYKNYYHTECLKNVLSNPEKHLEVLDCANNIADIIQLNEQDEQRELENTRWQIHRAHQLSSIFNEEHVVNLQETSDYQQSVDRAERLNITLDLLDKIDNSLSKLKYDEPKIKTDNNNKFAKIFKDN